LTTDAIIVEKPKAKGEGGGPRAAEWVAWAAAWRDGCMEWAAWVAWAE